MSETWEGRVVAYSGLERVPFVAVAYRTAEFRGWYLDIYETDDEDDKDCRIQLNERPIYCVDFDKVRRKFRSMLEFPRGRATWRRTDEVGAQEFKYEGEGRGGGMPRYDEYISGNRKWTLFAYKSTTTRHVLEGRIDGSGGQFQFCVERNSGYIEVARELQYDACAGLGKWYREPHDLPIPQYVQRKIREIVTERRKTL